MKQIEDKFKNFSLYLFLTFMLFLLHIFIPSFLYGIVKNLNIFYLNNKLIYSLVMIVICLIEMILFSLIFNKEIKSSTKKNLKKDLKYHLKFWLIGLVLMILFNIVINMILFKGSTATNEDLNRKFLSTYPIYSIFSLIFYAPFCEELIFRATLKKGFKNIILFSLISALLFGGIHVLESVFTASSLKVFINQLLYILPYGTLGFCFAYAYFKTDNINADILTHIIHNLFVLIIVLIA